MNDIRLLAGLLWTALLWASEAPQTLHAYRGSTPVIDGVLAAGEWSDATAFEGVSGWTAQFSPVSADSDLALRGWVKHDGRRLYFAFEVADDVLYGIDTPRWLPEKHPRAHELTPEGLPWLGDGLELLLNASNVWKDDQTARGDGTSWQMVLNTTKSRLGGLGVGGLLEGEPRRSPAAFDTYRKWIRDRSQEAVVKIKPGGKGYVVEWAISFNPCLEVEPGKFFDPANGSRAVGLNIAVGDLDEKSKGEGNAFGFHHEQWFAGPKDLRTQLRHWGTLWLMASPPALPPRLRR